MAKTRRVAHRRLNAPPWAGARWTPQQAQRVLEAWQRSGLALATWCRRQGIDYERVRRWRKQQATRSQPSSTAKATFLPVRVIASEPAPEKRMACFELELAGGRRLHVPAQFDAAALARLLGVLEARA